MKKSGAYSVRISGLNDGVHEFGFDLGNSFFKLFDHPDISGGAVKALIIMEKKPGLLTVNFDLTGEVSVVCDRCLDHYPQAIEVKEKMYVKFGDKSEEINEDIILIQRDEYEIVVDQFLFEFIILGLPSRRTHPDNDDGEPGCNEEMMEKLNEHLVRNDNTTDPRWDDLKRLIEKKN